MFDYIKKLGNRRNFKNFIYFLWIIKNPFILPMTVLFPKIREINFIYNKKKISLLFRNIYDLAIIFEMFVTGAYPIQYIKSVKTIADVGAHCGYFAVWACITNDDVQVYSFEPDSNNCSIYNQNIEINGLQGRVQLFPYGLGKENKSIIFYRYPNSADNSSTLYEHIRPLETIVIQIKNAKEVLTSISPELLKVDIEGAEDDVLYSYLDGGARPLYICAEFSNNSERTDKEAITRFIKYPDYEHSPDVIIVNSKLNNTFKYIK